MEQQEINYKDVIDLGFNVEQGNDNVYYNIHGHNYTIVTLDLKHRFICNWDCTTRLVEIMKCDKEGNILSTMQIMDESHLKHMINFINGVKTEEKSFTDFC